MQSWGFWSWARVVFVVYGILTFPGPAFSHGLDSGSDCGNLLTGNVIDEYTQALNEYIELKEKMAEFEINVLSHGLKRGLSLKEVRETSNDLDELHKAVTVNMEILRTGAEEMDEAVIYLYDFQERFAVLKERLKSIEERTPKLPASLEDIGDKYSLIDKDREYTLKDVSGNLYHFRFSQEVVKDLFRRPDRRRQSENVIKAMGKGFSSQRGEGIKRLNNYGVSSKGEVFEIKVARMAGAGHLRLLGCHRYGIFYVLRFEPDAPTSRVGYNQYAGLCGSL